MRLLAILKEYASVTDKQNCYSRHQVCNYCGKGSDLTKHFQLSK